MAITINASYINMPTTGSGTETISNRQWVAPYTSVTRVLNGSAASYTYTINTNNFQLCNEITLIIYNMAVSGPVSEYITTTHTYGTHNWTLSYATPAGAGTSLTTNTNLLGVSGTTTSGYRLIKLTRGGVSGSSYVYTAQVYALGLGTGVYRQCSGYAIGYGQILSIVHSLSAGGTFSSYSSQLYVT